MAGKHAIVVYSGSSSVARSKHKYIQKTPLSYLNGFSQVQTLANTTKPVTGFSTL